jgi:MFS transporter, OPA family, glycerol-3-phosphate transporter
MEGWNPHDLRPLDTGAEKDLAELLGSCFERTRARMFEIVAILMLLATVTFVIWRLPSVEIQHSKEFRFRRVMNWLPLGLTYAFLYMGRYNLKVSKFAFEEMKDAAGGALMGNDDFGFIFTVGVFVYGSAFLINGPLTDKFGGKFAILLGAGGSCIANLFMGLASYSLLYQGPMYEMIGNNFTVVFSVLYAFNMYFQSFGAVAIVKCNAPWFHVRERGVFGAIFGILISLGIYFAFDVGYKILNAFKLLDVDGKAIVGAPNSGIVWIFMVPAIALSIFWVLDFFLVRNTPGEAGLVDFDTADASSGDDGPPIGPVKVFVKMVTNPVIMTIAAIEFCSGFIRQAPMQWYRTFAKQTNEVLHLKGDFIYDNWGIMLCMAGILGGVIAGTISDHLFQSRRGPVAAVLYAGVTVGSILLLLVFDLQAIEFLGTRLSVPGIVAILISMCVIGVHGMLSGTASMDFGGKKNVGMAVGIIDGFVYLGTGVMSLTYAFVLPKEEFDEAGKLIGPVTDPANWRPWPISMIIIGILGFLLATRVWNAKPKGKTIEAVGTPVQDGVFEDGKDGKDGKEDAKA